MNNIKTIIQSKKKLIQISNTLDLIQKGLLYTGN